jgi:hypothetical protein
MSDKPLGSKAYGHIGHLIGSRMGPGDHKVEQGQCRIATERLRDKHDEVIVQEKLDGSCVAVARIDGALYPLGRAGHVAISSPYEQHRLFHDWVMVPDNYLRFLDVLRDGERLVGEWLAQAHGTRYALKHEPFVPFDIMVDKKRFSFDAFMDRIRGRFPNPCVIHRGGPLSIEEAMKRLLPYGNHGALDTVEGAVWRVHRKGEVDFLAKFVRPDKSDGCYLPEVSGKEAVWNWRPAALGGNTDGD